jgi:hypothetical protein
MPIVCKVTSLIIIPALFLGISLDALSGNNDSLSYASIVRQDKLNYAKEGIEFMCNSDSLSRIKLDVTAYLLSQGIAPSLVVTKMDASNGSLTFTLNTPNSDLDTLQLKYRTEYAIRDGIVRIPNEHGELQKLLTVSKKEILLALLQHGRLTEFSGKSCNVNALKEQVNVRQNIVAWAEQLNWTWPDGEAAAWNEKYWHKGTPLPHVKLHVALADAFKNQSEYAIGCYTAAKLVMVQGVLDYYRRVKRNKLLQKLVEAQLLLDHEPLVDIEPGEMWSFEQDFDSNKLTQRGKILKIQHKVAPLNFVPGDWVYIVNTDPVSAQKTGYEGSNAIYLGRNKFVDYYNDNHHAYTYQQKLDEVYQWRNGVFNRRRDVAKIQPLSVDDLERLGKSPAENGLVQSFRVFPMSFENFVY